MSVKPVFTCKCSKIVTKYGRKICTALHFLFQSLEETGWSAATFRAELCLETDLICDVLPNALTFENFLSLCLRKVSSPCSSITVMVKPHQTKANTKAMNFFHFSLK